MIFKGYFNQIYTVEEISINQLEDLLAQQSKEKLIKNTQAKEDINQLLNGTYSYRGNLNRKGRPFNF